MTIVLKEADGQWKISLYDEEYQINHFMRISKGVKKKQKQYHRKSTFIPYGRQHIDKDDIQAVINVLRSDWITQGPEIEGFEMALSEYCGAKYAVAVNSGTSALHIACLASNVKEGDEVITSPVTFVASANCAVYCGARPVFADIDPQTYNILPEEIGKKINERTRAVIPVHFAGQSCDMESIYRIVKAKEKQFKSKIVIIEDACHALGSRYKVMNRGWAGIGSCMHSEMVVLSFHPVKHITTGEGGAVLTNDETLYRKMKHLRSHGITNNPAEFIGLPPPNPELQTPNSLPWYYEQIDLGFNYRITDIQCALGLSQLKKLQKFRKRRRKIVDMYNESFSNTEYIQRPFETKDCDSNFHIYVLLFDFEGIGIKRSELMTKLRKKGIQTQVHYIPVHTQPFYRERYGTKWGDCPNAERYYQRCLSLPLYPAMTDGDVKRVIDEVKRIAKPVRKMGVSS